MRTVCESVSLSVFDLTHVAAPQQCNTYIILLSLLFVGNANIDKSHALTFTCDIDIPRRTGYTQ